MKTILTHFYWYGYAVSLLLILNTTEKEIESWGDFIGLLIVSLTSWGMAVFTLIEATL